jgi:hypothetical protein
VHAVGRAAKRPTRATRAHGDAPRNIFPGRARTREDDRGAARRRDRELEDAATSARDSGIDASLSSLVSAIKII